MSKSLYLMLQNDPIMEFNFDEQIYRVLDEDRMPIRLRSIFNEPEPKDIKTAMKYYTAMTEYFQSRILNLDRKNAKKILNAFHFSQSQDAITKTKIAIACKAVSMTDDYWINDSEKSLTWEKMNPRKNHLNSIISHVALTGSSLTATGLPHTPELTGQGAYAKAWIRENDNVYLYKCGNQRNEEKIEIMVSKILDCFDVDHVSYESGEFEGRPVSKCPDMSTDDFCIVSAEDFYTYCNREGKNFLKETLAIDSGNFYKTCTVDYLISNSDRHAQNWGFYMDNKTGVIAKLHPLFDHNNAFDRGDMESKDGGQSLMLQGKSKREAALYSESKHHLRCIKPVTKNIFLTEDQYYSFMDRACELGLYRKNERNIFDKLKHKEEYSPVKIEAREYSPTIEKIVAAKTKEEPDCGSIIDRLDAMDRSYVTVCEREDILR